ncbi:response regulator transcription factor [Neobacillus sp. PS3-34]|uniref:response regulator transcription factor n=1 Tax=Neobacillus sp. PS3-34 TaxID=3070678 RepID=UPI0027E16691|nr:response regulator transcription factor [Neobacillus sp. PS3-34]WML46910.1 response regulator transcription factor [Neobacillus sp. PS3-34]
MGKKLLILEEDSQYSNKISQYFESLFEVNSFSNGLQGLITAIEWKPNIVLINHSLLNVNSLELCRQMRQKLSSIIIIIGKPLNDDAIIQYYEAGADDVITHPITFPVLLCKIKVLLEHTSSKKVTEEDRIQYGLLTMNKVTFKVHYDKRVLNFTKKEFSILWTLVKKQDEVVTREELLRVVWSYEHLDDDRMIDTHLNRIRKKLKEYNIHISIKTVWGIGYKLQVEEGQPIEQIK